LPTRIYLVEACTAESGDACKQIDYFGPKFTREFIGMSRAYGPL